jgi:hypothetical protein
VTLHKTTEKSCLDVIYCRNKSMFSVTWSEASFSEPNVAHISTKHSWGKAIQAYRFTAAKVVKNRSMFVRYFSLAF